MAALKSQIFQIVVAIRISYSSTKTCPHRAGKHDSGLGDSPFHTCALRRPFFFTEWYSSSEPCCMVRVVELRAKVQLPDAASLRPQTPDGSQDCGVCLMGVSAESWVQLGRIFLRKPYGLSAIVLRRTVSRGSEKTYISISKQLP